MNEITLEQIEEITFLLENDEVVSREEIRQLLEAARKWVERENEMRRDCTTILNLECEVKELLRDLSEKEKQLDAQVTEWIAAVNERNIAWKKIGALMVLVKEALRDHGPWRGYDEEMRTWETRARKVIGDV